MSSCTEGAHCSEDSPEESFVGGYANYTFGTSVLAPMYAALPGFLNAKSQTSPDPVYVRTITLRDWGQKQGQAVETMEPEQVEHKPTPERLGDRLSRVIRPVHEPFDPRDFIQKAADFLTSIGVVHVASLEVDGAHVYVFKDGADSDLRSVVDNANSYFDSHKGSVRQIDLKVFGRSDYFFLEMVLTYRPLHSPHEAAFSVAIGARPVALHAMPSETFEQYADRTTKLRSDPAEVARFEKEVDEKGRELVSDLSYHISSAFPGARFTVIEQDESGDIL